MRQGHHASRGQQQHQVAAPKKNTRKHIISKETQCTNLYNKGTSLNRQLKDEYYSTLVLENLDNPDRLWKAIKKILPQSQSAVQMFSLWE